MIESVEPTAEDLAARIAQIEAEVTGIREAYEGDANHGDSCWLAEVGWHPLASKYDALRWLQGTEKPRPE